MEAVALEYLSDDVGKIKEGVTNNDLFFLELSQAKYPAWSRVRTCMK